MAGGDVMNRAEVIRQKVMADFSALENEIATSLYAQLCGPMGRVIGNGPIIQVLMLRDRKKAAICVRKDLAEWPEIWRAT